MLARSAGSDRGHPFAAFRDSTSSRRKHSQSSRGSAERNGTKRSPYSATPGNEARPMPPRAPPLTTRNTPNPLRASCSCKAFSCTEKRPGGGGPARALVCGAGAPTPASPGPRVGPVGPPRLGHGWASVGVGRVRPWRPVPRPEPSWAAKLFSFTRLKPWARRRDASPRRWALPCHASETRAALVEHPLVLSRPLRLSAHRPRADDSGGRRMNAITLLEADHQRSRKLLSELESTTERGIKTRSELFATIKGERPSTRSLRKRSSTPS